MDPGMHGAASDLAALLDLEAIKQLKARYCRYVDTRDWERLREVFADAAWLRFPQLGSFDDPESFVVACRSRFGAGTTVHHAVLPEIELLPGGRARGVWATHIYVEQPPASAGEAPRGHHAYGHYHEDYVRARGGWRIVALRLTLVCRNPLDGPLRSGRGRRPP
jgi:hypothetical protein